MPNDEEIQKRYDSLIAELEWNWPIYLPRRSDLKRRLRQLNKLESRGAILRGSHCPLSKREDYIKMYGATAGV